MSGELIGLARQLGLEHPWQVALYLPTSWRDRNPVDLATLPARQEAVLAGQVVSQPSRHTRPPRMSFMVADAFGTVPVTIFGEQQPWHEDIVEGAQVVLEGVVGWFREQVQLRADRLLTGADLGRLSPVYPGRRGKIGAEELAERLPLVLDEAIRLCSQALRQRLAWWGDLRSLRRWIGATGTLNDLIATAHRPASVQQGEQAVAALEKLAGVDLVHHARNERPVQPRPAMRLTSIDTRLASVPFAATQEQRQAMADIAGDLARPCTTQRLLVGDVGTGKSLVYQAVCMAVADAGGRAAILAPNDTLAQQVFAEISAWWPDVDTRLVTAASQEPAPEQGRVLVGTTALLARPVGTFDLVVIDEQHKFSVAQRERLCAGAHRLEVTATCIPRSGALLAYGTLAYSQLLQGHTNREVRTRLWAADERLTAFEEFRQWLDQGKQLLVVYSRKAGAKDDRRSVYRAQEIWERLAPGRVVVSTSDEDHEVKQAAAAAMRDGTAQILVATTTIEVGVSLPDLYRIVIVDPDRFGVVQLHQLRGRVARKGGVGYCDLLLGGPVKAPTQARLDYFVKETSGPALAMADLVMRGFGDLSGSSRQQSGAGTYLLGGRTADPQMMEAIMADLPPQLDRAAGQSPI